MPLEPPFNEDQWQKWFTCFQHVKTVVFITAEHIFQHSDVAALLPLWFMGPPGALSRVELWTHADRVIWSRHQGLDVSATQDVTF